MNALPDMEAGKRFPAPVETPALTPGPPPIPEKSHIPSTLGSADREIGNDAPAEKLLIPVAGIDRKKLTDTYKDARDGRHEAIDIMAPRGTPVLAAVEGNVVKLFRSKEGGNTVYQFDNAGAWCYYYAHLDRYADGLKEGVLLRRGDTLGYVGSTGDADATAPHLHFAIFRLGPEKQWWKATPVNPYPLLAR